MEGGQEGGVQASLTPSSPKLPNPQYIVEELIEQGKVSRQH